MITRIRNKVTGETLTVTNLIPTKGDEYFSARIKGEDQPAARPFWGRDWDIETVHENANEVIRDLPVGTVLQVTLVGGNAASITTYSRHVKISDDTLVYLNPNNGGPVFNVAIQGHCTALPADRVRVIFNPEEVSK